MIYSRKSGSLDHKPKKKSGKKKALCYFDWYDKVEKETAMAVKKVAGLV